MNRVAHSGLSAPITGVSPSGLPFVGGGGGGGGGGGPGAGLPLPKSSRSSGPLVPQLPQIVADLREEFAVLLHSLEADNSFTCNVYIVDLLLTLAHLDVNLRVEERRIFVRAYDQILQHMLAKVESMKSMVAKVVFVQALLESLARACGDVRRMIRLVAAETEEKKNRLAAAANASTGAAHGGSRAHRMLRPMHRHHHHHHRRRRRHHHSRAGGSLSSSSSAAARENSTSEGTSASTSSAVNRSTSSSDNDGSDIPVNRRHSSLQYTLQDLQQEVQIYSTALSDDPHCPAPPSGTTAMMEGEEGAMQNSSKAHRIETGGGRHRHRHHRRRRTLVGVVDVTPNSNGSSVSEGKPLQRRHAAGGVSQSSEIRNAAEEDMEGTSTTPLRSSLASSISSTKDHQRGRQLQRRGSVDTTTLSDLSSAFNSSFSYTSTTSRSSSFTFSPASSCSSSMMSSRPPRPLLRSEIDPLSMNDNIHPHHHHFHKDGRRTDYAKDNADGDDNHEGGSVGQAAASTQAHRERLPTEMQPRPSTTAPLSAILSDMSDRSPVATRHTTALHASSLATSGADRDRSSRDGLPCPTQVSSVTVTHSPREEGPRGSSAGSFSTPKRSNRTAGHTALSLTPSTTTTTTANTHQAKQQRPQYSHHHHPHAAQERRRRRHRRQQRRWERHAVYGLLQKLPVTVLSALQRFNAAASWDAPDVRLLMELLCGTAQASSSANSSGGRGGANSAADSHISALTTRQGGGPTNSTSAKGSFRYKLFHQAAAAAATATASGLGGQSTPLQHHMPAGVTSSHTPQQQQQQQQQPDRPLGRHESMSSLLGTRPPLPPPSPGLSAFGQAAGAAVVPHPGTTTPPSIFASFAMTGPAAADMLGSTNNNNNNNNTATHNLYATAGGGGAVAQSSSAGTFEECAAGAPPGGAGIPPSTSFSGVGVGEDPKGCSETCGGLGFTTLSYGFWEHAPAVLDTVIKSIVKASDPLFETMLTDAMQHGVAFSMNEGTNPGPLTQPGPGEGGEEAATGEDTRRHHHHHHHHRRRRRGRRCAEGRRGSGRHSAQDAVHCGRNVASRRVDSHAARGASAPAAVHCVLCASALTRDAGGTDSLARLTTQRRQSVMAHVGTGSRRWSSSPQKRGGAADAFPSCFNRKASLLVTTDAGFDVCHHLVTESIAHRSWRRPHGHAERHHRSRETAAGMRTAGAGAGGAGGGGGTVPSSSPSIHSNAAGMRDPFASFPRLHLEDVYDHLHIYLPALRHSYAKEWRRFQRAGTTIRQCFATAASSAAAAAAAGGGGGGAATAASDLQLHSHVLLSGANTGTLGHSSANTGPVGGSLYQQLGAGGGVRTSSSLDSPYSALPGGISGSFTATPAVLAAAAGAGGLVDTTHSSSQQSYRHPMLQQQHLLLLQQQQQWLSVEDAVRMGSTRGDDSADGDDGNSALPPFLRRLFPDATVEERLRAWWAEEKEEDDEAEAAAAAGTGGGGAGPHDWQQKNTSKSKGLGRAMRVNEAGGKTGASIPATTGSAAAGVGPSAGAGSTAAAADRSTTPGTAAGAGASPGSSAAPAGAGTFGVSDLVLHLLLQTLQRCVEEAEAPASPPEGDEGVMMCCGVCDDEAMRRSDAAQPVASPYPFTPAPLTAEHSSSSFAVRTGGPPSSSSSAAAAAPNGPLPMLPPPTPPPQERAVGRSSGSVIGDSASFTAHTRDAAEAASYDGAASAASSCPNGIHSAAAPPLPTTGAEAGAAALSRGKHCHCPSPSASAPPPPRRPRRVPSLLRTMQRDLERMAEQVRRGLAPLYRMQQQLRGEMALLTYRVISTIVDWLIPGTSALDRYTTIFYRSWLCDLYAHLYALDLLPVLGRMVRAATHHGTAGESTVAGEATVPPPAASSPSPPPQRPLQQQPSSPAEALDGKTTEAPDSAATPSSKRKETVKEVWAVRAGSSPAATAAATPSSSSTGKRPVARPASAGTTALATATTSRKASLFPSALAAGNNNISNNSFATSPRKAAMGGDGDAASTRRRHATTSSNPTTNSVGTIIASSSSPNSPPGAGDASRKQLPQRGAGAGVVKGSIAAAVAPKSKSGLSSSVSSSRSQQVGPGPIAQPTPPVPLSPSEPKRTQKSKQQKQPPPPQQPPSGPPDDLPGHPAPHDPAPAPAPAPQPPPLSMQDLVVPGCNLFVLVGMNAAPAAARLPYTAALGGSCNSSVSAFTPVPSSSARVSPQRDRSGSGGGGGGVGGEPAAAAAAATAMPFSSPAPYPTPLLIAPPPPPPPPPPPGPLPYAEEAVRVAMRLLDRSSTGFSTLRTTAPVMRTEEDDPAAAGGGKEGGGGQTPQRLAHRGPEESWGAYSNATSTTSYSGGAALMPANPAAGGAGGRSTEFTTPVCMITRLVAAALRGMDRDAVGALAAAFFFPTAAAGGRPAEQKKLLYGGTASASPEAFWVRTAMDARGGAGGTPGSLCAALTHHQQQSGAPALEVMTPSSATAAGSAPPGSAAHLGSSWTASSNNNNHNKPAAAPGRLASTLPHLKAGSSKDVGQGGKPPSSTTPPAHPNAGKKQPADAQRASTHDPLSSTVRAPQPRREEDDQHHHAYHYPVITTATDVVRLYAQVLLDAELVLSPHDPLHATLVLHAAQFLVAFAPDLAREYVATTGSRAAGEEEEEEVRYSSSYGSLGDDEGTVAPMALEEICYLKGPAAMLLAELEEEEEVDDDDDDDDEADSVESDGLDPMGHRRRGHTTFLVEEEEEEDLGQSEAVETSSTDREETQQGNDSSSDRHAVQSSPHVRSGTPASRADARRRAMAAVAAESEALRLMRHYLEEVSEDRVVDPMHQMLNLDTVLRPPRAAGGGGGGRGGGGGKLPAPAAPRGRRSSSGKGPATGGGRDREAPPSPSIFSVSDVRSTSGGGGASPTIFPVPRTMQPSSGAALPSNTTASPSSSSSVVPVLTVIPSWNSEREHEQFMASVAQLHHLATHLAEAAALRSEERRVAGEQRRMRRAAAAKRRQQQQKAQAKKARRRQRGDVAGVFAGSSATPPPPPATTTTHTPAGAISSIIQRG